MNHPIQRIEPHIFVAHQDEPLDYESVAEGAKARLAFFDQHYPDEAYIFVLDLTDAAIDFYDLRRAREGTELDERCRAVILVTKSTAMKLLASVVTHLSRTKLYVTGCREDALALARELVSRLITTEAPT